MSWRFLVFTFVVVLVAGGCGTEDGDETGADATDVAADEGTGDAADEDIRTDVDTSEDAGGDDVGEDDVADVGEDIADTGDDDADVGEDIDVADVLEDPPVDAEPIACGGSTCAADEVCIIRCLCCGIDTGNPADQQTEYACAPIPETCEGRPSACVGAEPGNGGCFEDGDRTLTCPCA